MGKGKARRSQQSQHTDKYAVDAKGRAQRTPGVEESASMSVTETPVPMEIAEYERTERFEEGR
ncbi:hypothetical protein ACFQLX_00630 [Streptomyces polyrhachis]|uniref:DUF3073 family protein n=1 Tax=Streptomyces polyrhachis TaxID=1282885 RepID=A0ABW2G7D8_9ACTN